MQCVLAATYDYDSVLMDWHNYIIKKDYYTAARVSLEDAKEDLKPLVTKVRAIRKEKNRKEEHQNELIQQWEKDIAEAVLGKGCSQSNYWL